MKLNLDHPVLLIGLLLLLAIILGIVFSDTYGADPNPTGSPIGGGRGYSGIIAGTEAGEGFPVSTKDQLVTALSRAQPGDVVFVTGTSVIDLTGESPVGIPAGVTLAGNRGSGDSPGATIKKSAHTPGFSGSPDINGWHSSSWEEPMFYVMGDNVRVTGLQLEGEMYPQDYGNKDGETPEDEYLVGIFANAKSGFEVDNNEIRGWAWSGVSLKDCPDAYIHHNHIHRNQARGEGYGSNLYGGHALFEANLYDYNRHSIAAGGYPDEGYEARYNIHLGHGNAIGGHHFDVHAYPPDDEETIDSIAGYEYRIHHNTFESTELPCIGIRALPVKGVWIEHNIFKTTYDHPPVFQRSAGSFGRMYMARNYIGKMGTHPLFVAGEEIWYISG